jgi:UDP-glucose 4-epimerase
VNFKVKVLVLGGNGFIGSNLVERLVAEGHRVRIYDRSPSRLNVLGQKVEQQNGNFNDITSISQALHDIDIVFHLISGSIPSTSNLSPADDARDNLVDTIGLLECMRKIGITRIVYMSSGGTIYGNSNKDLINEEHSLNPNCSYGIVKLAVEKYLMMYQRLYDFEPVILRVSNPYGPWQSKVGIHGLIGTLLSKAISNERVDIWGDGEVVRDYIHIKDVIEACINVMGSKSTGIFNIGSGVGHSVNEVLKMVEEVTQSKLDVKYSKRRDFDVKKIVLDISNAKKVLNWAPKIAIKDGIKTHNDWLQSL